MIEPMPFQLATADAAEAALRRKGGARRFLVADEVGLGKTIVAQELIRRMLQRRRKPLVVFYVCSSLSIASQNRSKLLEILPEQERRQAQCEVDRLTLMPASEPPSHPRFHLYTLTPATSIPVRKGMRRDGRAEERALIHVLIEGLWPRFFEHRGADFFRRNAYGSWPRALAYRRSHAPSRKLLESFKASVRAEFALGPGRHLLSTLLDLDDPLELIARLRNALAASAVESVNPDLVVFDEFQRFRDLIGQNVDEAAARVVGALRGETAGRHCALVLLSATPYRLYAQRWEEESGTSHHQEFFQAVEFLYGGGQRAAEVRLDCERNFAILEEELRRGSLMSQRAASAREELHRLLRPVMARTERASHCDGWADLHTEHRDAPLEQTDLAVYRHLVDCLAPQHRLQGVPYWTSIPLPMQTMGSRYVVWDKSDSRADPRAPELTLGQREAIERPEVWPHPRLRALSDLVPTQHLGRPWVAPSLPWWTLRGPWAAGHDDIGKVLVFSRFRAVPPSVAACLSYDLEAALQPKMNFKYEEVTSRRLLSIAVGGEAVLARFHPSPWLAANADPLAARGAGLASARQVVERQLRGALRALGIGIQRQRSFFDRRRSRPIWQVMAGLERAAGNWTWVHKAWRGLHELAGKGEAEAGLGRLVESWDYAARRQLDHVTPEEFEELCRYALGAPGIVLGRALARHWPQALTEEGFATTLEASWSGLRPYLGQRWFSALLSPDDRHYPDAMQDAVVEGNLEAVLDEHLWITSAIRSLSGPGLAENLRDSLRIRTSVFYMHPYGSKSTDSRFTLRCHAAMPFIEAQMAAGSEGPDLQLRSLRTDELRRSFNSPFWPHVLTTTSVGQEGLDFHAWCSTVVHWDLCGNPTDLEQREGRIQRYGALQIRRRLARDLGERVKAAYQPGVSPWAALRDLAETESTDPSGLAPWWVYKDAAIRRFVFDVPSSEQAYRLERLREQRMLYRLALGMPNQEDVVATLSGIEDFGAVRNGMLRLSPWDWDRGRPLAATEAD